MPTPNATAARNYRQRVAASGRKTLRLTVATEAADRLHALAEQRAESPGRALEHVLDVAAPVPLSPRKQARLMRCVDETMAVIEAGEKHVGKGDLQAHRRTARRLGAAR